MSRRPLRASRFGTGGVWARIAGNGGVRNASDLERRVVIVFVLTAEHAYTHKALLAPDIPVRVRLLTYAELLRAKTIPRATYVFTDMDRLSLWDLRIAAGAYRRLHSHGLRVLNDPARVTSRWGLLRRPHLAGINNFDAYRAEESVRPRRWPVFLRTEGDHLGPASDLLHSLDQLQATIDRFVSQGAPLPSLLIVEYSAQPVRPGLYRKFGSFRLGRAEFAHTCVHDDHWIAKTGKLGITPPEIYDGEHRIVRDNPHGRSVAAGFDIAGIGYGRADFGLVDGKVQIYEINSNPDVVFGDDHPSPVRRESYRIFKQHYLDALSTIDTPDAGDSIRGPLIP